MPLRLSVEQGSFHGGDTGCNRPDMVQLILQGNGVAHRLAVGLSLSELGCVGVTLR